MAKNEDIYKVIIDYIQEDNRWKESMNKQVASIEYQTKQTNGRLVKAESTIAKLDQISETATITHTANWKWIAGILVGVQFIFTTGIALTLDWVKKHLI